MSGFFKKGMSLLVSVALASTFAVAPAFADTAHAAGSSSIAAGSTALDASIAVQSSKYTGWSDDRLSYYRKGKKLTGLHKIKSQRYYFSSEGVLQTSDFEIHGVTYYVRPSGKIFGAKAYGQYYYKTLKPMTSDDAYDFETYLMARSIVNDITDPWDSKETKLWKSFCWVMDKSYAIHRDFNPYETNWPATYARFHFENRGGDCHSDGAAFGYLAAACGYDADVCIDSMNSGRVASHCWTMIGNAVYDPLFYQSKGSMYFGATSGTYEVNPTARFRVPTYSPKNAAPDAVAASALIQAGYSGLKRIGDNYFFFENGDAVTNTWKTVNGKRYHFGIDGAADKGSVKVGKSYYVFNGKGVLQNSKKAGKRLVKVGKEVYRVNKKGKAVGGWTTGKKMRFTKTGMLLTGKRVVNGKFFVASKKGIYKKSKTKKLNRAAKSGKPAAVLYKLLGKPKAMYYSSNCEGKGKDGLWEYKHFIVTTIRPSGVKSVKKVAKSLAKGKPLAKRHEYIVGIEKR